jgi:endoglucanase
MKRFLFLWALVAMCVARVEAKEFEVKRGVNISHWLSQSDDRGEVRVKKFTREDVKFIAEAGFDHIRIPIDEEQMFDEALKPEKEAFELLHNALAWCKEFDLRVVVDLHILRTHHFNAASKPLFTERKAQEQFFDCWRMLSAELKKYPRSMVAYELMNEPVADDPEQWNVIVNECLAAVRELEPKRTVIIGANRWQSFDQVKNLRVPEDDKNIIISFHFYNPFAFTHYRASWTDQKDNPLKVTYPGKMASADEVAKLSPAMKQKYGWLASDGGYNDINTLEQQIKQAYDAAAAMGRKAYLGEFGVIDGADEPSMVRWYRDIVAICEKYDIGYTTWDYKGGFGILRDNGQPWQEKIDALLGK